MCKFSSGGVLICLDLLPGLLAWEFEANAMLSLSRLLELEHVSWACFLGRLQLALAGKLNTLWYLYGKVGGP